MSGCFNSGNLGSKVERSTPAFGQKRTSRNPTWHGGMLNKIIRVASTLVLTVVLAACDNASSPLRWIEDVRLPDGRIVTLTRYQEFKGPHEWGNTPTVSDYWFEFKHPDTGQVVRWQSDRDLDPLALFMDAKVPMLLVRPNFDGVERRHCPNPPYLLFRFVGVWEQVPLERIPVRRLRANLTFGLSGERKLIESSNFHLTAEQTSNTTFQNVPFIINFSLMKEQTFGIQNCGRNPDRLLEQHR